MQNENQYASVRVVDRATALTLLNLSMSTWERLQKRGDTPPATRISDRRVGYRISDLEKWLDARRVTAATT